MGAPVPEPTQHNIAALQTKVRAGSEEFNMAIACHEAWKPAAYDAALHERLNQSFAANTFITIRQVLRREMLLALMRLWDNNPKAVGMASIAKSLKDDGLVDALAAACEAQWENGTVFGQDDVSPEHRAAVEEASREAERAFGWRQAALLRESVAKALALIEKYSKGGSGHDLFQSLRHLRNKRLAHREVASVPRADATDEQIEAFYQDMATLIELLRSVAENVCYLPEETANIRRRHAALFWDSVCGERHECHPAYRPRP
jgi:AbiU2